MTPQQRLEAGYTYSYINNSPFRNWLREYKYGGSWPTLSPDFLRRYLTPEEIERESKADGLFAKPGTYDDADPIGVLDVDISSRLILDEILGIKDLRSDKRIDFVGGLRGLGELKRRVDSGEMKMALALHPVTMLQIMDIADSGKIMPPKATWFEPKLRSGLIIHKLD